MTFSEYALDLSPFISYGKDEHDYFTELVGNFIKDAAMDSCRLLKMKPDTKYRFIKGDRLILPKHAQYLYDLGIWTSSQNGYGTEWTTPIPMTM